ncbi:MAG: hypothetical protein HQM08_18055 [Candidatus Riflebacteria bacterium]|nr:hypothetical protein [Candidatus Riflebacteria bacterium]
MSPSTPKPIFAAIIIYDPVKKEVKTCAVNPSLSGGNFSYVYNAPKLPLHYRQQYDTNAVQPYMLFIGMAGAADSKGVHFDYSGSISVIQRSQWLVDFNNGKFNSKLAPEDGDVDNSKPRDPNQPLPSNNPPSVNADMDNPNVSYIRYYDGTLIFPMSKGIPINYGDVVNLGSEYYKHWMDAEDDKVTPRGNSPEDFNKQWEIFRR